MGNLVRNSVIILLSAGLLVLVISLGVNGELSGQATSGSVASWPSNPSTPCYLKNGNNFEKGQLDIFTTCSDGRPIIIGGSRYRVEIKTGRSDGAGTDSNIYLTGDLNSFVNFRINSDKSGKNSEWFLEYVIFRKIDSTGAVVLGGRPSDIRRKLYLVHRPLGDIGMLRYFEQEDIIEVEIKTCNKDKAGTDAKIYIDLETFTSVSSDESYSQRIVSIGGKVYLSTPNRNDFEKGQTDVYYIGQKQYKMITSFNIGANNFGDSDNAWLPDSVYVRSLASQDDCYCDQSLDCKWWLNAKHTSVPCQGFS